VAVLTLGFKDARKCFYPLANTHRVSRKREVAGCEDCRIRGVLDGLEPCLSNVLRTAPWRLCWVQPSRA
jgi:hypothetical protein